MHIPYYPKYKICQQNLQLLGDTFTEYVSLCAQLSGNPTWGIKKMIILHLDRYGISHLLSCSSVFSDSNNSSYAWHQIRRKLKRREKQRHKNWTVFLLMSLMPDYNSHVCGTWKIVTGWTLWHTTYTLKIFLFFSIIIGRIFKTTGSTDLHNSDYSKVSINSLTCFF
jgi:hypothetical protein